MTLANRTRFYLVGLLVSGGFVALVVRLWAIQIDRYDEFSKKVPGTSEVSVRIPGVRGLIRDRRGRVLVDNIARYEMRFDLKDILEAYKAKMAIENAEIAQENRTLPLEEQREKLKIPVRKFKFLDGGGVERNRNETDVFAIVSEIVFPHLNEIGLYKVFNSEGLQRHWRTHAGLVPYTYRDDLSFEEFAIAAENSLDLPGVSVASRPLRRYIYGSLASHILGFVNQPDIQKVPAEERSQWDYYVPDDYGADGVEATQDQFLRGKAGRRVLLKDEKGRIVDRKDESGQIMGELSYDPPQSGADIWLSIDRDFQYIVESALREAGIGRGAAVVVAPSSYRRLIDVGGKKEEHWVNAGDVLAMAAVPCLNPNKFIPSISEVEFKNYEENRANPFMNRALKRHAPGSTFKLPVALAGALAGVDNQSYPCEGGAGYGNAYFKCWVNGKGYTHGSIYTREGIMHSCNGYFYRLGNAAGIRNINKVAHWMGLGEKTGIPLLDEDPGVLPSPEQKRSLGQGRWGSADTAQVSIGQHQVEATPLQMAIVAATVGNGGLCYRPRLIHKVVEAGVERADGKGPVLRYDLVQQGVPKSSIAAAKGGMWDVVNKAGGTARRARSEITQISGKTGTAQTGHKRPNGDNLTNTWFVCFAPYDKPRLAVCVMVENGKAGGSVCAPIAKKIIDEIISIDEHAYSPSVAAVPEAQGDFDFVELVSFDDNPTDAFIGDDEANVGSVAATPVPDSASQSSRTAARKARPAPTVRAAPDSRGSIKPPTTKKRTVTRTGLLKRWKRGR